ncbi:hypothetical protein G436_2406 [Leptospira interrogans serovar Hardjo str. Norma]|uniref:Uncharacterized protein n=1 Tax=Leptospira interrogans serovar Hardjo str. Norma TaxID=1279460 RepID=A0A0M4N5Z4_LEPIR|nr:hypothetical protein G436_2406 [Leptospira interrogans serovar Hardjo str. Norma]
MIFLSKKSIRDDIRKIKIKCATFKFEATIFEYSESKFQLCFFYHYNQF